jgi:hypothetical protein
MAIGRDKDDDSIFNLLREIPAQPFSFGDATLSEEDPLAGFPLVTEMGDGMVTVTTTRVCCAWDTVVEGVGWESTPYEFRALEAWNPEEARVNHQTMIDRVKAMEKIALARL